jgi:tRNA A-37 threonylcarbamoyl transferase component Bud32
MATDEEFRAVLDSIKYTKPTATSCEDTDEKSCIDNKSPEKMDLQTIDEDQADSGDDLEEMDFLFRRGVSFHLGHPKIKTSYVENVDVLNFGNYASDSKIQEMDTRSPSLKKVHPGLLESCTETSERSDSVILISTASGTDRSISIRDKIEVICTPKRKSIRISQTNTLDMRRISLRLGVSLVLKQGNPKNKFEIHEVLGSGTFGKVRRAICKSTKQEVAIKRIKKKKLDQMNKSLLENEIRILREIKHDSIVRLYDVWETKKYYCLIMELCSSGDVFDWLEEEEHFDEVRASGVLHQIVTAVEYLHARGVVHRDLKLENLLIGKQKPNSDKKSVVVKIADFGFATTIKTPDAKIEGTCGSLNYVAPEVLTGRPYTKECDLWSVGVILYTMLAGFLPFYEDEESGGRGKTFRRIQQGIYDLDDDVWFKVGDLAKTVVRGLLTVKVSERLRSNQVAKHRWIRSCSGAARRSTS